MSTTAFGDPTPDLTAVATDRAGFWIRLGASLIDGILIAALNLVLILVIGNTAGQLVALVVGLAYYIYLEGPGGKGQTVGKRVCGIRVVSSTTGGPIGYGAATGRYFGRILSAIPIFLGYFWMIWDRENQTWHDKLAGSYVVSADR